MPPTDLFVPQAPPASLEPVQFDFAAAAEVIAALRDAARVVQAAAAAREDAAALASVGWTGPQQQHFQSLEHRDAGDAAALVGQLNGAAGTIERLVGEVHAEDARRAVLLGDWQRGQAAARAAWEKAMAHRQAG